MVLPSKTVKVSKKGARHKSHDYIWATAQAYLGQEVQLRYMPHDERCCDVYYDGSFVATAYPAQTLDAEETLRFLANRDKSKKRATSLRKRASRAQRGREIDRVPSATGTRAVRYTPQNGEQELAPVIAINRSKAQRELLERDGLQVDPDAGLTGLNLPFDDEPEGDA